VYRAAQRPGKRWCTAWCTGLSDRELAAIFDEAEQEKPLAAVLRSGPGRPSKDNEECSQARTFPERSQTKGYTLARLRRDDPDSAARVERGELSVLKTARGPGVRLSRSA
jgi:hypothetical protein